MHPIAPICAAVDDMAWLAGRWLGEDATGRLEETWSEPHAGMILDTLHVPGDEFRYSRG